MMEKLFFQFKFCIVCMVGIFWQSPILSSENISSAFEFQAQPIKPMFLKKIESNLYYFADQNETYINSSAENLEDIENIEQGYFIIYKLWEKFYSYFFNLKVNIEINTVKKIQKTFLEQKFQDFKKSSLEEFRLNIKSMKTKILFNLTVNEDVDEDTDGNFHLGRSVVYRPQYSQKTILHPTVPIVKDLKANIQSFIDDLDRDFIETCNTLHHKNLEEQILKLKIAKSYPIQHTLTGTEEKEVLNKAFEYFLQNLVHSVKKLRHTMCALLQFIDKKNLLDPDI